MPQARFFANPEAVLSTLARLFAAEGAAREVAILTYSTPEVVQSGYLQVEEERWATTHTLYLHVVVNLFAQMKEVLEAAEQAILERSNLLLHKYQNEDRLTTVKIVPAIVEDAQWRDKAQAWLAGKVSNQGRVRSDNVAALNADGLLFRSNPEIHFYRALKGQGVAFAPLAVFVRGGEKYCRIEPDFFIVHQGFSMVVEIDGDTVHQETPEEAHARMVMLEHHGVQLERINASECDTPEKAQKALQHIMVALQKRKAAR